MPRSPAYLLDIVLNVAPLRLRALTAGRDTCEPQASGTKYQGSGPEAHGHPAGSE